MSEERQAALIFDWCVAGLSLAVLIYGATSWCLISKFRHFKNYVYLNAVLANFLRIFLCSVILPVFGDTSFGTYHIFIYYVGSVQTYWLLVICCLCYVDIVKVFNGKTQRRYLKSTLFAWGVPIFTTSLTVFVLPEFLSPGICYFIGIVFVFIPMFINVVLYIKIVCSLFDFKASVGDTNHWRRFYIATVVFIFCDAVFLSTAVLNIFVNIPFLVATVLSDFQVILLDLFVVFLRSNRELWREFYMKRMAKSLPTINNTTFNETTKF